MDKKALDKEVFNWAQSKLEKGKFPCICGHFESSHVKRMCLACHGEDESGENINRSLNCWHLFNPMDNLSLIEWMAKHKEDIYK